MIKFTSEIKTDKSEIGIAAWQEQSDVTRDSSRKVTGAALLVVRLLKPDEGHYFGPETDVKGEVENFLCSAAAEKIADAFDLDYARGSLSTIQAGQDTWFVWLSWNARRDVEPTPGEAEWASSRGIPGKAYPF